MSRVGPSVRGMEAHVIPLHQAIRLEGDRIVIERLSLSDPTLAAFLGERPAGGRGPILERAMPIGGVAGAFFGGGAPKAGVPSRPAAHQLADAPVPAGDHGGLQEPRGAPRG